MMTLTNASIMFTAFIISVISAIIVFVAGVTSGVVRMTTLLTRTFFAVMMSGAASYLVLMLFDWHYERNHKKFSAEENQAETPPEKSAEENKTATAQPAQDGFKPMNANELPKA